MQYDITMNHQATGSRATQPCTVAHATVPPPLDLPYLARDDIRNGRVVALGGRLTQARLDVHPLHLARERAHDEVLVVDLMRYLFN